MDHTYCKVYSTSEIRADVPPIIIVPKVEEHLGDYCEAHGNIVRSNETMDDTYGEALLIFKGKECLTVLSWEIMRINFEIYLSNQIWK